MIEGIRESLRDMAEAVEALDRVLADLAAALPASPNRDAMFECRIPFDVPTELFAVIETVREEYLAPASRALARAARAHRSRLEKRFRAYEVALAPRAPDAPQRAALP